VEGQLISHYKILGKPGGGGSHTNYQVEVSLTHQGIKDRCEEKFVPRADGFVFAISVRDTP
jgi:hypothetical protein